MSDTDKISNPEIRSLTETAEAATKLACSYDKAIEALQALCEHDYCHQGSTSHEDMFRCSKCGDTKFE